MPSPLWAVVWIGAGVMIALTYFFWMKNVWLHLLLNNALGISIGLLVFLIVSMDHPFWGEVSVGPDAFEDMREVVMLR